MMLEEEEMRLRDEYNAIIERLKKIRAERERTIRESDTGGER